MWANFAWRGYSRLVCTNTACVLPSEAGLFARALGADVRVTRVLLTATDATVRERLTRRELGSELAQELVNSARKARLLDAGVSPETIRVPTGGRPVTTIAEEALEATGWTHG